MTDAFAIRRMLLALDPDDWPANMLDAVTRMAAGLSAEIDALYVEDSAMTQAADMPATRFVSSQLGTSVQSDRQHMQLAMRARAAAARAKLAASAKRTTATWRFESAEGDPSEQLVQRANTRDLVVMSHRNRLTNAGTHRGRTLRTVTQRASCAVMVLNRRANASGAVLALYAGNEKVLNSAAQLAGIFAAPLIVLAHDHAATADAQISAAEWLTEHQIAARVLTANSADQIVATIRAVQPSLTIATNGASIDADPLLTNLQAETSLLILK